MALKPMLGDPGKPLVSVCIFNYNYGRYLRQCFDSVFAQVYDNIEIIFSDNASTDGSWDIALEYARKYPGTMTITCNRNNFGSDANFENCFLNIRGKYLIELCSDDALMPEYVNKCVDVMETHPSAGFVMVHRSIVDEQGRFAGEPPFYNQSCLIQGAEQAAVYMMAAVNPSISQVMYNKLAYGKIVNTGIASKWYGTRLHDFAMCCKFDMAYIKEPLLMHRLHAGSDSSRAAEDLIEVIGPWILRHQFAELASQFNLKKAADRLPQALDKLSQLALRYCARFLSLKNEKCAFRYFHLSAAIMPEIADDAVFRKIQRYWASDEESKTKIVEELKAAENLTTRNVSYDPPPGSIPVRVDK